MSFFLGAPAHGNGVVALRAGETEGEQKEAGTFSTTSQHAYTSWRCRRQHVIYVTLCSVSPKCVMCDYDPSPGEGRLSKREECGQRVAG